MIRGYHFSGILHEDGWSDSIYVDINEKGLIQSKSDSPSSTVNYEEVSGFALPGIVNSHSHAFQYAMAGLAEIHNTNQSADDFWSWRKLMYDIALSVDPDQVENIAAFLYAEMLRHGYTRVVEFHYLHHDKKGNQYRNRAELGCRLVAASEKAGIKITLVPIFYQKGGFGKEATDEQRRFISKNEEEYLLLWETSKSVTDQHSNANIGRGIHSLRAVDPDMIKSFTHNLNDDLPFHLHIAEQLKEVDDCLGYLNARPVEWALDNLPLTTNYHLVHSTHMTNSETEKLAGTGSHVVLCPSTEGNLGDGLFNLKAFQNKGGKWSLGTDSHIGLNPMEELRILDYGQRTSTHQRNIFTDNAEGDSGNSALQQIIKSGRAATGIVQSNYFEIGKPFDALVIDANHPLFANSIKRNLSSTIVYASDPGMYLGTIVNGKWLIRNGHHLGDENIRNNFSKSIRQLAIR